MPSSALPLVRAVLDTDTYNEVDDQFALAHLLLSPERVRLEAVYAAPFFNPSCNDRSTSALDGMEKSHDEIHRVLGFLPHAPAPRVFRGSPRFLPGAATPVESPAALDLVERAMATPAGEKLYVLGIAAPTNIASALLIEPRIAERIVLVWLGGHAPYWPHTREFNLEQDVHASRILLESAAPLILLPCYPVTSHLITTVPELAEHLAPHSRLGAYLTEIVRSYAGNPPGWSKNIWDISASAWLVNPDWVKTEEKPCPVLRDDLTWETDPAASAGRRTVRIARELDRDKIFADFFVKSRKAGR
ncbi:MAG TPA: nucleoside hydrolase [Candidatus Methylacidiphilales bacterium]